jgi:hypothetical protein
MKSIEKAPDADLRLRYQRTLELSAAIAVLLLTVVLFLSKI